MVWDIWGERRTIDDLLPGNSIRKDAQIHHTAVVGSKEDRLRCDTLSVFALGVVAQIDNTLPDRSTIPSQPNFKGNIGEPIDEIIRQIDIARFGSTQHHRAITDS